jgi:hypothetical protein
MTGCPVLGYLGCLGYSGLLGYLGLFGWANLFGSFKELKRPEELTLAQIRFPKKQVF